MRQPEQMNIKAVSLVLVRQFWGLRNIEGLQRTTRKHIKDVCYCLPGGVGAYRDYNWSHRLHFILGQTSEVYFKSTLLIIIFGTLHSFLTIESAQTWEKRV